MPPGGSGFTLSPFASAANTHCGDLRRLTRLIPDPIWPVTLVPSPWSNPREGHPTLTPRPEEGTSVISPRVTLSGRWPAGLWPASAEQGWCSLHATAVAPGALGVPTTVMVAQGRLSVMAAHHLPCPPPLPGTTPGLVDPGSHAREGPLGTGVGTGGWGPSFSSASSAP